MLSVMSVPVPPLIRREMKIVAGEILRRIEMQRVGAAVLIHVQNVAADQVGAAVRVVGDTVRSMCRHRQSR